VPQRRELAPWTYYEDGTQSVPDPESETLPIKALLMEGGAHRFTVMNTPLTSLDPYAPLVGGIQDGDQRDSNPRPSLEPQSE
jgi:hypothetical protein